MRPSIFATLLLLALCAIVTQHFAQSLIAKRRRNERKGEHYQREESQYAAFGVERRQQRHVWMAAAGKAQH